MSTKYRCGACGLKGHNRRTCPSSSDNNNNSNPVGKKPSTMRAKKKNKKGGRAFRSVTIEMHREVMDTLQETFRILGCSELSIDTPVEWNNRFTHVLGKAWLHGAVRDNVWHAYSDTPFRIEFSAKLWPYMTKKQRREVVIHEACHIVDAYRGTFVRSRPHGLSWRGLMLEVGVSPERTTKITNLPKSFSRKVTRIVKYCGCGEHVITKHRATKMTKGVRYRCRICTEILRDAA